MYVIVGESASGKTELVKAFVEKHPEYHKVITYTTRPKRENEVNGVDYKFVSQEEFIELADTGFFAEQNTYRGWYYGTALQDCKNTDNALIILTPAGLRSLQRNGVKMKSVYLFVDRRSRLIKLLNRGDNIEEAYRRNLTDVGQFDGIIEEVDYVIDNAEYHMSVDEVVYVLEAIIADSEGE